MKSWHLVILMISFVYHATALYQEQPAYKFLGLNLTQNHIPYQMILSNDEQKVAVYFLNGTTQRPQYKILRFDGSQRCRKRVSNESEELIGWPKGQNLMFLGHMESQIMMLETDCNDLFILGNFSSQIKGARYSTKAEQPFAGFLTSSNQIHDYNLATRKLLQIYKAQANQQIISYEYSSNHRYIFMQVSTTKSYNQSTIRVYDTVSGNKVKELTSSMMMVKVIERGDYYLAVEGRKLYKVDMSGNGEAINEFEEWETPLGFCTSDDVLVSLQVIKAGTGQEQSVRLVVYSSDDGSLKQSIWLGQVPYQMRQATISCNQDKLAIMDQTGNIIVYKYNYAFPVLIVVTSMIVGILVVAVVVAVIMMRRINRQSEEQYRKMEGSGYVVAVGE